MSWLYHNGGSSTVTVANKFGGTPMNLASARGSLEMVRWLYAHGAKADLRAKNKNGGTPFMGSCASGDHLY